MSFNQQAKQIEQVRRGIFAAARAFSMAAKAAKNAAEVITQAGRVVKAERTAMDEIMERFRGESLFGGYLDDIDVLLAFIEKNPHLDTKTYGFVLDELRRLENIIRRIGDKGAENFTLEQYRISRQRRNTRGRNSTVTKNLGGGSSGGMGGFGSTGTGSQNTGVSTGQIGQG